MTDPVVTDTIFGLENAFTPLLLSRAAREIETAFSNPAFPGLVVYNNDVERGKFTCENIEAIGPACIELFNFLRSEKFVRTMARSLELTIDLEPAERGAGAQVTVPGGHLGPHLDYALHPSGKERRANVIMFLNAYWPSHGGGELVFYYPDCTTPRLIVEPVFGRIVAWESDDEAYHGVNTVAGAVARVTAAMYYLAKPRKGITRTRALFAPNRGKNLTTAREIR